MSFIRRRWRRLVIALVIATLLYPIGLNLVYGTSGYEESILLQYLGPVFGLILVLQLTFFPPANVARLDPLETLTLFAPYVFIFLATYAGVLLLVTVGQRRMKRTQ